MDSWSVFGYAPKNSNSVFGFGNPYLDFREKTHPNIHVSSNGVSKKSNCWLCRVLTTLTTESALVSWKLDCKFRIFAYSCTLFWPEIRPNFSGSLECNFQSKTKIKPDLSLIRARGIIAKYTPSVSGQSNENFKLFANDSSGKYREINKISLSHETKMRKSNLITVLYATIAVSYGKENFKVFTKICLFVTFRMEKREKKA